MPKYEPGGSVAENGCSPHQPPRQVNSPIGSRIVRNATDRILNRVLADIEELARFSAGGPGVTRVAYSREDLMGRQWFKAQCKSAGLSFSVDRAGNSFGWSPSVPGERPILIGSHLDTVPEGGRYDGIVGVVVGLEVIRELVAGGSTLPAGVGVFACEESTRFGLGEVGSRLATGQLSYDQASAMLDLEGRPFKELISSAGLADQEEEVVNDEFISAYIEVHIDQGTLLSSSDAKIGIVDVIAGLARNRLCWRGQSSHSAGRRRGERKDALLTAAEYLIALDALWARLEQGRFLQMTVGHLDVRPNSPNTVPGSVDALLDVRALEQSHIDEAMKAAVELASSLARTRGLEFLARDVGGLTPLAMDSRLSTTLALSARTLGFSAPRVPSFAGHDAMVVGKKFPAAMVLIANPTGMSHSPDESVDEEGLVQAIATLYNALREAGGSNKRPRGQTN